MKTYNAPRLTYYGDLSQLTRADFSDDTEDFLYYSNEDGDGNIPGPGGSDNACDFGSGGGSSGEDCEA